MAFVEDLAAYFADFSVPVVWGVYSCRAIYSKPGMEVLGGIGMIDDHTIQYVTSDLPGLGSGQTITVNGASFTTQTPRLMIDGKLSIAGLSPA